MSPKHDYSSSQMSKLASTPSFEGTRHLVAMALLEGQRRRQATDEEDTVATERSRPLKKRKTVTPQKASSYPAHVSPMSHMSILSEAAAARDDRSQASTPRVVASTSTSYEEEVKEEEEETNTNSKAEMAKDDHDTKKEPSSSSSPPPTHVVIPHFPSVLHTLLTDSEYANKVVQWLPHGKAWKIVRWEALRRQVLPQFFAAAEEQSKGGAAGSIDAFLWHLTAWGFEEITEGPDAGAYAHEVRVLLTSFEVCVHTDR